MSHSDDLHALLAKDEPVIDLCDTVRIFESSNGIREIHAVLAKIFSRFCDYPIRTARMDGTGYQ